VPVSLVGFGGQRGLDLGDQGGVVETGRLEPTSPVITPRPRAEISQRSRAGASLCAAEPNRAGTGMAAVNGRTVKP